MTKKYKHAYEVLKAINEAKPEDREAMIQQYGAQHPFNLIFALNFSETIKVDLPEGIPEGFSYETVSHPDLVPQTLHNCIKRLGHCFSTNKTLPKWRKEMIFFDMLKSLAPDEGEVLVFIKDKALTELYPNITKDLIEKHFPNYTK